MRAFILVSLHLLLMAAVVEDGSAEDGNKEGVEILILGDTSFGENYHDLIAAVGGDPVLRTRGYDYMIANFVQVLRNADFTVANLETPITDTFPSPYAGRKKYIHYADVVETPRQLEKHGFDLVSLANNHAFDYGARGLEQTLRLLTEKNIDTCGAGPDLAAAGEPYVRQLDVGQRAFHIAFLCSFEYKSSDNRYGVYAGEGKPGVHRLEPNDVAGQVKTLRARYPDLLIVAFPHWGKNYKWATESQRTLARALIDAGVDLIIGHGAHMIQEVEGYGDRWIVYSLGNFVFGSLGRFAEFRAPPFGTIATLRLEPASNGVDVRVRLHPIFSNNLVTHFQPRFVTPSEFEELIAVIRARSQPGGVFETSVNSGKDDYGPYLELDITP